MSPFCLGEIVGIAIRNSEETDQYTAKSAGLAAM